LEAAPDLPRRSLAALESARGLRDDAFLINDEVFVYEMLGGTAAEGNRVTRGSGDIWPKNTNAPDSV